MSNKWIELSDLVGRQLLPSHWMTISDVEPGWKAAFYQRKSETRFRQLYILTQGLHNSKATDDK